MSGGLQMLLVVLLSVAVGATALIYYLRTRGRSSRAQPAPSTQDSTTPERGATVLGDSSEDANAHEAASGDELAGILEVSCDGAKPSAAAPEGREEAAILGELPARTGPGVRAGEETGHRALNGAPHEEHVELPPTTAEQAEVVENLCASRDEGEHRQDQPVLGASGDSGEDSGVRSHSSAETAATAVAEERNRPAEEHTCADAAHPDEVVGAGDLVAVAGATSTSDDEQPPGPAAQDKGAEPNERPPTKDQLPRRKRARNWKPRKYKGLARAAPQPRDATPQPGPPAREEPAQRELTLPIEVRLRFVRGGSCSVSLIAKRSVGLSEDLTAVARGAEVNLRAMQDEWYQDIVPDDFSSVLKKGTVWRQERASRQCTWSLSGRELYVLADRPDISGYVSQPSLDLGRDHVVLCTEPLRSRVEEAIRKTGAQPPTVLGESFGAPPGWIVFRSVVPHEPVTPSDDADIFNALRPLPRIEISLERGIRLEYSNWLHGRPPSIRVYGDPQHASEVRIDGQVAERLADGAYRASRWDVIGSHSVWCAGTSRSYSIVPFEASWQLWDAYAFPVAAGRTQRLAVCGPIVRAATTEAWGSESFSVPETNLVLLGPEPGQIVMAVRASPLRGLPRIASPGFRPIWALPRDPLHCDKKTTWILCVAGSEAPGPKKQHGDGPKSGTDADVARWCKLILDANRKGMSTNPDTEAVRALWLSYKRLARRIWRSRR